MDAAGNFGGGSAADELFGTETMAELCARQGRLREAIAIYRRLLQARPGDERRERWTERTLVLERATRDAADGAGGASPCILRGSGSLPPADPRSPLAPPSKAGLRSPEKTKRGENDVRHDRPSPLSPLPAPAPAAPAPLAARPAQPVAHRLPLVVRQPVRSGQIIYAERNDLIVLAPVNPGAELIADGNIHIYAPLRGRAVAGAHGATQARIFCRRLEAELCGIDSAYVTAEAIPADLFGKPAQIWLDGTRLMIEPL